MSEEKIKRLGDALLKTIDEFAQDERLTTGDAMGALFGVMVLSAMKSPGYSPRRLVDEVSANIRKAVGLND
jgi:hypothetical protein